MLLNIVIFLVGLIVLSWSADRFVYGASALAKNIGISPMMIGLTIVAMGSSAPEIVVSAIASANGNMNTAVGNALGSNITNIALVLGITALVKPLLVSSTTLKRELPALLIISLIAIGFMFDGELKSYEGIILLGLFIFVLAMMAWLSLQVDKEDPLVAETADEIPKGVSNTSALIWIGVGLVILPLSAHFLVNSAVEIARYMGISDLVIGLTIIAFGTSLPELAASVAGVLKGEDDLALGNIIGSNIFNLLAVLGMPGLIAPGILDPDVYNRDMYVMLGLTLILFLFSFDLIGKRTISRTNGFILLACFIGYQFWLFG
ncbi:sodium-calcium exchanger [Alteromonas macleodii str. 'Black Sea 11']|uniref:calcium/sodium antiporter n=2 Tax=Alteromonas abrolhosensis TaxID=1892904 RepID=UPI000286F282|nr:MULTISPECIES: calcium/sodium antiporter [Alteromonas]AFT77314.1 sodium-calcium exchanger [Alteromonas macleodii str. 'Black Sea 11']NKW88627.1 calcium/sodium antiporter [Alteromonadaceae bacterium A_SAG4]NKX05057.1 calcium/sodium antiporter [Alteromonadaceae bacterium A_SAG6]NKX18138.1 calcium/sodium antiporter [Alteromonadaceae bacterium A_SAG5]NKX35139.1 calcium/sodium antiporter [Alteromonadaceae bacterium A_SAG3]NKX69917.1 calcium/sodium antiporter [Alteromonadaceae bacterium A_SAG7]